MKCQLSTRSTNYFLFLPFLAKSAHFSLGWPAGLYFPFQFKGGKKKVLDKQAGLRECACRKFQKVELSDSWIGTGLRFTSLVIVLFMLAYLSGWEGILSAILGDHLPCRFIILCCRLFSLSLFRRFYSKFPRARSLACSIQAFLFSANVCFPLCFFGNKDRRQELFSIDKDPRVLFKHSSTIFSRIKSKLLNVLLNC